MANYRYINKDNEDCLMASEGTIWLDNRLSNSNKAILAKNKDVYKRRNLDQTAVYIAKFNSCQYESKTGKYLFKTNLIKL
jgi:hypothetical protein